MHTVSKSQSLLRRLRPPRRRLVTTLADGGIGQPFPIQTATLPDALAGRDVLGRGRTGSGKTLAFTLPVVARLAASESKRTPRRPRALVLAPTRELASQIDATMAPLAKAIGLRTQTVYGGVRPGPQQQALRNGVDIVIACPGRLADLMQGGHVQLDGIEVTVLDEADHMADLGFLPTVRRLLDRTPQSGSACCSPPRSTVLSTCSSSATWTDRRCTAWTPRSPPSGR